MRRDANEHLRIGGQTGGHIPKNLTKNFKLFVTLPNIVIKCKVVGKCIIEELDTDKYLGPVQVF